MTARTPAGAYAELARLLADGRKQAASPSLDTKMVKQGELQFEFGVTPETTVEQVDHMVAMQLHGITELLKGFAGL